jgi:hypothetical protein
MPKGSSNYSTSSNSSSSSPNYPGSNGNYQFWNPDGSASTFWDDTYVKMASKNKKIKETFTHIRDNWKEEHYKKCSLEWKINQPFISKEQTPYHCGGCDTYWTSIQYINDHENICPKCDTHYQPMLCNPINWLSVLEYIDPKYHDYLIPNRNIISFLQYIKDDNYITEEIGLIGDDFAAFLDGITLKEIHIEYIGFYEEKTKNAYIYVKQDAVNNTIIYNAWQLFNNNDEISIKIYGTYCGNYSVRDDYKTERKYFYKYLMKMLVDKVFEE